MHGRTSDRPGTCPCRGTQAAASYRARTGTRPCRRRAADVRGRQREQLGRRRGDDRDARSRACVDYLDVVLPGASRTSGPRPMESARKATLGGGGAGDGNSTRSLTRLLRTSFPIQASRNGLDCGLKSSAWSTQAVAGDPKRAKHIHQQPEHRISFGSLSVYWHTTPRVATDKRTAVLKGLAHHRPARPRLSLAR